jgi:hypothetical protein
MQRHELTDEQREKWGIALQETAKHLQENYDKIPFHS